MNIGKYNLDWNMACLFNQKVKTTITTDNTRNVGKKDQATV